jgi:hypothetical protein
VEQGINEIVQLKSGERLHRTFPWALALLVLVPLLLYWPLVWGEKAIFWGTASLQFWPWRRFAVQELAAGRIPLWNPYTGNGGPLLADHQSAVFYPLNLIWAIVPADHAMGLSLFLHVVLAGWLMYALARELRLSRLGGLVAALAFACSSYMVARGSFLTEISALPWLPLLWFAGRRLMQRPSLSNAALLAGGVALQFLAGHAQTWFYSLCALLLYATWVGLVRGWLPGHLSWRRLSPYAVRYALLALAVLWGMALAAAQFIPTLELSQVTARAGRESWESFALQYSFWPWRVLTLVLPDFFGNPVRGDYWGYATYWEDAGYIGVLPALLALLAVAAWLRWRKRADVPPALHDVPFWAGLCLLALLMALGKHTPVYMFFFRYVPGFDTFQAPARWLCVYTASAAVLAGIGTDALRPAPRLTFVCRLGVAGGVSIGLVAAIGQRMLPGVKATFFTPLIQFAGWFVASMFLLLWGQSARSGRRRHELPLYGAAVVLVVAADLVIAGQGLNPGIDPTFYVEQTGIGAFLAGDGPQGRTYYSAEAREAVMFGRYLDFKDYGPTDPQYWWGMRESLLPDLGMVEHLSSANSFEPLVAGRYHALLEAVDRMPAEQALRVLGMMHVAYILDPGSDPGAELAYRSPAVNVYRNPNVLPRAYVVCRAREAHSAAEALRMLSLVDFDPATEAIIESPLDGLSAPCGLEPATILRSVPNQVTIRAILSQPGYLVLTDTIYPGWQARVDGQQATILAANGAFRAVALPAGAHEVAFVYRPLSFAAGVACSTAALAGLCLLCLGRVVGRGKTGRRSL